MTLSGAGTSCFIMHYHHATARKKCSKEVNIEVMECYYRLNPIDGKVFLLKGIGKEKRMYKK